MANSEYDPPLSQAGFMDLIGAILARLKEPDGISTLAAMPQIQRYAALQIGLLAQNYVDVVEGRSLPHLVLSSEQSASNARETEDHEPRLPGSYYRGDDVGYTKLL